MVIAYSLALDDALAFVYYQHQQKRMRRRFIRTNILWAAISAIAFFGLYILTDSTNIFTARVLPLVILGVILVGASTFAFSSLFDLVYPRYKLKKDFAGGRFNDIELQVMSNGLSVKLKQEENLMQWNAVLSIVITDAHIFFIHSDVSATIVPRRIFSSEEHYQQFVKEAQGFYRTVQDIF